MQDCKLQVPILYVPDYIADRINLPEDIRVLVRDCVFSGANCTREFGVVQRVCVLADLCLGRWEALAPSAFGPNQATVHDYFEITLHG